MTFSASVRHSKDDDGNLVKRPHPKPTYSKKILTYSNSSLRLSQFSNFVRWHKSYQAQYFSEHTTIGSHQPGQKKQFVLI